LTELSTNAVEIGSPFRRRNLSIPAVPKPLPGRHFPHPDSALVTGF